MREGEEDDEEKQGGEVWQDGQEAHKALCQAEGAGHAASCCQWMLSWCCGWGWGLNKGWRFCSGTEYSSALPLSGIHQTEWTS